MDISTQQKQQQSLTLTPSLRLALEVLRIPLAELEMYLQQQLEENPLLEKTEDPSELEGAPEIEPLHDSTVASDDDPADDFETNISELWQENDGFNPSQQEEPFAPSVVSKSLPLHDYLLHQLYSQQLDGQTKRAAEILLNWLDPDGYLYSPLEEISQSEEIPVCDLEKGLAVIQRFEPAGVGARSLTECLLIQLAHRGDGNGLAAQIIWDHFDLLVKQKWHQLASKLRIHIDALQEAVQTIARLDPKPARNFSGEVSLPVTPDLIMRQAKDGYEVEVNDESLPKLILSSTYRQMLRSPSSSFETKTFIREKMRQGSWLIKAIEQRKQTLLSIARCVVQLQKDYFTQGIQFLRALTQEEISKMVGCHPSTISRAIAGKTIQTPYGVVPLETFFGGGISLPEQDGKKLPSRTIQAEIENLIARENPEKPLSDHALALILREKGYPVARRTVAKYRTQLKILPAHFRHKLVSRSA